jgi:hypothetical protein
MNVGKDSAFCFDLQTRIKLEVEANNIDEQLAAALSETARLRSEKERLRKLLRIRDSCPQVVLASGMDAKAAIASSFSSDEKVRLFRGL